MCQGCLANLYVKPTVCFHRLDIHLPILCVNVRVLCVRAAYFKRRCLCSRRFFPYISLRDKKSVRCCIYLRFSMRKLKIVAVSHYRQG
jgi:hypothetical protein